VDNVRRFVKKQASPHNRTIVDSGRQSEKTRHGQPFRIENPGAVISIRLSGPDELIFNT
jgi:hypothetical protein